jgi:hypothetical protein
MPPALIGKITSIEDAYFIEAATAQTYEPSKSSKHGRPVAKKVRRARKAAAKRQKEARGLVVIDDGKLLVLPSTRKPGKTVREPISKKKTTYLVILIQTNAEVIPNNSNSNRMARWRMPTGSVFVLPDSCSLVMTPSRHAKTKIGKYDLVLCDYAAVCMQARAVRENLYALTNAMGSNPGTVPENYRKLPPPSWFHLQSEFDLGEIFGSSDVMSNREQRVRAAKALGKIQQQTR